MTKRTGIIIAVIVVVAAAVGGGIYWFLRDDAPDEASVDTAAQAVRDAAGNEATDDPGQGSSDPDVDGTAEEADGIEGTWTVDTETGEFTYEEATGTFAGFRVEEELTTVGSTTAVGRTGDVSGEVVIEDTTMTAASFEVDLTTITTDQSMRDDRVQSALNTGEHPTATFALTEPVELGDGATTGERITVTAAGELTVNGITQPIELAIEAELVEGSIVLTASTELTFADFDVEVPSAPIVVSAEDHGILEAQIILVR